MNTNSRVLVLVCAVMLVSTADLAAQSTSRIAGWNLLGYYPIPESRIPALAEGIIRIDADLVAVVEVNPTRTLARLVDALGEEGHDYVYRIISQPARQKIGILFKPHVQIADEQLIPRSDIGDSDNRKAFFCRVKINEFDFFLVAVHLKSSRSGSDRAIRNRQAAAIARFLQSQLADSSERDVLIVGDYNMIPNQDQTNFETLGMDGYLQFISSEELESGSHIGRDGELGNLLDGYAISRDHTSEYAPGTLEILPLHEEMDLTLLEFSEQVSDHLPLVATFNIDRDDDQDRFDWSPFFARSRVSMMLAEPSATKQSPSQPVAISRQDGWTYGHRRTCRPLRRWCWGRRR